MTTSAIDSPKVNGFERAYQWTALAVAAFFSISGTAYLWLGHWPVTHADFWHIYYVCLNRSWLESAWLKYNGHSHFFPSQLWLADLRFFHGNEEVLFAIGFLLTCLSVALLVFPVWKDTATTTPLKSAATLILLLGNFWIARANMIFSGGFACCYALTLGGTALAFWQLYLLSQNKSPRGITITVLILSGIIATFSFGTGLILWPTLLIVGYCFRARVRLLIAIAGAALLFTAVFVLLPARELVPDKPSIASLYHPWVLLERTCHLLGAPASYAIEGWVPSGVAAGSDNPAVMVMIAGALGLLTAVTFILLGIARRNIAQTRLHYIGFALMLFNLGALVSITIGRDKHFSLIPGELDAPRYLYWSSLFWAGLFVLTLQLCSSHLWLRRVILGLTLILAIFLLPSHYEGGAHWRLAKCASISATTSLINEVRDEKEVGILGQPLNQIYLVARIFRARRLDMFAGPMAYWIGRRQEDIFGAHPKSVKLRGQAYINADVPAINGGTAARVSGSILQRGHKVPTLMVVSDEAGVIRGIGQSCSLNEILSRVLYGGKFENHSFLAYIRDYNSQHRYSIRAVEGKRLSAEAL